MIIAIALRFLKLLNLDCYQNIKPWGIILSSLWYHVINYVNVHQDHGHGQHSWRSPANKSNKLGDRYITGWCSLPPRRISYNQLGSSQAPRQDATSETGFISSQSQSVHQQKVRSCIEATPRRTRPSWIRLPQSQRFGPQAVTVQNEELNKVDADLAPQQLHAYIAACPHYLIIHM